MARASIRDLCERYDITPRTIRFYEERGLIVAQRDRCNIRVFGPEACERLHWITLLRSAGVSLDEIAVILDGPAPPSRAERALEAVRARSRRLREDLASAELIERNLRLGLEFPTPGYATPLRSAFNRRRPLAR